ncbi:LamG domain-containing protein [Zunongwangia sp. F363]|uniref:LamG domain-containing protein n=1 Tax=Autumnicola tepida TaxID=3075595 RepID=A0ABU3CBG8_9FLAO|nr:LamG domain-containing protein [Zunongwangia sp. F363]MDT0643688.1 LamG domain-containing protein [Zunongwangia sp. F363]
MPGLIVDKVGKGSVINNTEIQYAAPVTNIEDLNALPADAKKDKQRRFVRIINSYYSYNAGNNTWNIVNEAIESSNSPKVYGPGVNDLQELQSIPQKDLKDQEHRFVTLENAYFFYNGDLNKWEKVEPETEIPFAPKNKELPRGKKDQQYFITEHGTNKVIPDYLLKRGIIVQTPREFDVASSAGINLEEVYKRWEMFSHYNNTVQGGLTAIGETSPPNFPALNELEPNAEYRLTAEEFYKKTAWGYDAINDRIFLKKNYHCYTGFISPREFAYYTFEATLSSSDPDDDFMTLVIAFWVDPKTGYEHTLSVIRSMTGNSGQGNSSYRLVYNFSQTTEETIIDGTALAPYPIDGVGGWNTTGPSRLSVVRNGNTFYIKTSQFGSTKIDDATLMSLNLEDFPQLEGFTVASKVGFAARSQKNAFFSNVYFTGLTDYIFWSKGDFYDTYEWNLDLEEFILQDPQTVFCKDYFGMNRFVNSYMFNKQYYITERDEIICFKGDEGISWDANNALSIGSDNKPFLNLADLNSGASNDVPSALKFKAYQLRKEITSSVITKRYIYAGIGESFVRWSYDEKEEILLTLAGTTEWRCAFEGSDGSIYFSPLNSTSSSIAVGDHALYRYKNGIVEKVLQLADRECIWGIDEDGLGNIFAGVYSLGAPNAKVYKTSDGDSWEVSFSGLSFRHIHDVHVDQTTNNVYVCAGDDYGANLNYRSTDNGGTWEAIITEKEISQFTAVLSTPTSRLFGTDQSPVGQIYRTTNDQDLTLVLDTHYQNCFFLRQSDLTGYIYAGFKLDPSGTSENTNNFSADIWVSKNDGVTWELLLREENLLAGEGFWFASEFHEGNLIIGFQKHFSFIKGIAITEDIEFSYGAFGIEGTKVKPMLLQAKEETVYPNFPSTNLIFANNGEDGENGIITDLINGVNPITYHIRKNLIGLIDNAFGFVGNSYAIFPKTSNTSFTDGTTDLPFGIAMRVKFAEADGDCMLISRIKSLREWYIYSMPDKIVFRLYSQNNSSVFISKEYIFEKKVGVWYDLFFTYNGSHDFSGLKIYVNGVSVGEGSMTGAYAGMKEYTSGTTGIGTYPGVGLFFKGALDGLYIWKDYEPTLADVEAAKGNYYR